jgi:hypothetical protein
MINLNLNFITLVILSLAAFRLTRFVTTDTIFNRQRSFIWRKFPPESTKLGYLITCPWCIGVWLSSLVYLSYIIFPEQTIAVCSVLCISAIVGLVSDRH